MLNLDPVIDPEEGRYSLPFLLSRQCHTPSSQLSCTSSIRNAYNPQKCLGSPVQRRLQLHPHHHVLLNFRGLTRVQKSQDHSFRTYQSSFIPLTTSLSTSLDTPHRSLWLKYMHLFQSISTKSQPLSVSTISRVISSAHSLRTR